MNWLIPNYNVNIEYKNVKCKYCGTIIIFNKNIKSKDGKIKPINLDNSPHNCNKF
jgi:hypothetical protein